jgi:hypothetical protein
MEADMPSKIARRLAMALLVAAALALLLSCKPEIVYDQIVIDTFSPTGGSTDCDTFLTLTDAQGKVLATDDDGNSDISTGEGYSRINYQKSLTSGTYYIKVEKDSTDGGGYYGVRVLDYFPADAYTALTPWWEPTPDGDDNVDVDAGGVPTNPWDIAMGNAEAISRAINPDTDVDWFKLVLP